MGTWRASSEADTRQDSRVQSAKTADTLTIFILDVQEIVRNGIIERAYVCCLAVKKVAIIIGRYRREIEGERGEREKENLYKILQDFKAYCICASGMVPGSNVVSILVYSAATRTVVAALCRVFLCNTPFRLQ